LLFSVCAAGTSPALALDAAPLIRTQPDNVLSQSAADLEDAESLRQLNSTSDLDVVLDLTPEQVEQLDAIFADYQPRIRAAYNTYTEAAETMVNLLEPETSDAALTAGREDLLTAERAVEDLIFQRNLALRDVLDMEQRQVINTFLRQGLRL
jgi:Spy/CpxP family protein refolding chaperone